MGFRWVNQGRWQQHGGVRLWGQEENEVGAKLLLVPENAGGSPLVPAVSAGAKWKTTDDVAEGSDDSAFDYYLVATRLITQTPWPGEAAGAVPHRWSCCAVCRPGSWRFMSNASG